MTYVQKIDAETHNYHLYGAMVRSHQYYLMRRTWGSLQLYLACLKMWQKLAVSTTTN